MRETNAAAASSLCHHDLRRRDMRRFTRRLAPSPVVFDRIDASWPSRKSKFQGVAQFFSDSESKKMI
jgi:hypothetical protein